MEKNFIWTRNPSEAYSNPYEYEAQEQFSRESLKVLSGFRTKLELYNRTFHRDNRSLEKAIWMLLIDGTDTLIECHDFLLNKKHKIAGRLFRDAVEVIDLSTLFLAETEKSKNLLEKWYDDQVIPNRDYRNYVKNSFGPEISDITREFYSQISKINHRTYRALAYGYILDKDGKFVYDGFTSNLNDSNFLVFPGIISMYYALLANLISILSVALIHSGLTTKEDNAKIWHISIEKKPENRRFKTIENVYNERNQ